MTSITIHPAYDADIERDDFGFIYANELLLDQEDEVLYLRARHRSNTAHPAAEWHGHTRKWEVPVLDAATYDALTSEVAPHAQVLVDGYCSRWNGSNHVAGVLAGHEEATEAALESIAAIIAAIPEDASTEYEWAESETELSRANDTAEQLTAEYNAGRGAELGVTAECGDSYITFNYRGKELPEIAALYVDDVNGGRSDSLIAAGFARAIEEVEAEVQDALDAAEED